MITLAAWKKANFSKAILLCSKFKPILGFSVLYERKLKSSKMRISVGVSVVWINLWKSEIKRITPN